MTTEPAAPLPPAQALPPGPAETAAPSPLPEVAAMAPAAAAPTPLARVAGWQPGLVAAWMIAIVALTVSVLLWQKVTGMQEQLARQSAEAGSQSVEARTLARQAEEAVRDNATRLAALEGRVGDLAAYRTQLDELVQSVTRARDENLAIDLEAALRVAQDQAQLTGSVEPLLAALRTAERRIKRSSDPRLVPVARAVARDLERVKSTSLIDTAGLLARIDQLLRQIDDLPAANAVGVQRAPPQPSPAAGTADATSWLSRSWQAFRHEAMTLLRVSRVERPEASMLSPEQVFFLRENLKLRLQGARLALLARQYEAARADLSAAQAMLGGYFDPAARRTQAAATLLQQIQGQTKSADLPRVEETLLALTSAVAAGTPPAGGR